jgi:hypothetical protein
MFTKAMKALGPWLLASVAALGLVLVIAIADSWRKTMRRINPNYRADMYE